VTVRRAALLAALIVCTSCDTGGADRATAELKDVSGRSVARAHFEARGEDVRVVVEAWGLPPGPHGIHVHEAGNCDPPDFTSAGAHFNPSGQPHHGSEANRHAGDLPNLAVGPDGSGHLDAVLQGITMNGRGHHSLFHKGGTSVVIHRDADDMASAPSGQSGPRIACGVVAAVR
jgi:Cu-Zn family superoxide dismutase